MAGEERPTLLEWDDYFMGIAELSAQRSKDPISKVGACIVNEKMRIVATGYNGMVSGWPHDIVTLSSDDKKYYVCHAEMNAVLNKNMASLEGCTLYSTRYPCCYCAKYIIQAGIRDVVHLEGKRPKKKYDIAEELFKKCGVKTRQLLPEQRVKLEQTAAPGSSAAVSPPQGRVRPHCYPNSPVPSSQAE